METTNIRSLVHFAVAFSLAVVACTCLYIEESAGVESCTFEARISADLRVLRDAMQLYRMDTGAWSENMKDLMERSDSLKGWSGPYLMRRPIDYWGKEYQLFKNKHGIRVGTFGADSLPGGEEDFFIDIITGDTQYKGIPVPYKMPNWVKWGWLISTGAAIIFAIALCRIIRKR